MWYTQCLGKSLKKGATILLDDLGPVTIVMVRLQI